ncbi:MAG: sn-glycerol-3-phosphate-binding periplasmic protein UgpB [Acidimicrobiales bacterium]|nr:sn-glycerol-3-phosphate-binding periplasmic protein UgpB [Acidimicrobiales bacterium]
MFAAACGGGDGADGGGDGETAAGDLPECPVEALEEYDASDGPIEVLLWHSQIAEPLASLETLTEEYNSSQDKVHVTLQSQGTSYEEVERQFERAIPTSDLPAVVVFDDTITQFMSDSGVIIPAQSCIDADGYDNSGWLPLAVDFYSIDDVMYPATVGLASALIYYNRGHFEEAGLDPDDPPETLEEVREYAEAIQAAGVTETPLAFNMTPFILEFWLTGAGAPIVDNNNGRDARAEASAFDNERTHEIFEWIDGMIEDGLISPFSGTPGQINHYLSMANEQSSMVIESDTASTSVTAFLAGNLEVDELGEDLPEAPDVSGLDIGAGALPGLEAPGLGQVGGATYYITNTTPPEVQAGAWDFLKFLNEKDSQVQFYLQGSYHPVEPATTEDEAVQEFWSSDKAGEWLKISYDSLVGIDTDFPGPLIGPYTEVRDIIRDALDRLAFERATPDEVIAEADASITEAIERYNEENF